MARKVQILSILAAVLTGVVLFMLTRPAVIHSQEPQVALPGPTLEPIIETPCTPDGTIVTQPAINHFRLCPEYLIQESDPDAIASITAIAYAPACRPAGNAPPWCGKLFLASPADGTIRWIDDFDPAEGTYPVHEFANDLAAPNGLAWHGETLYAAGQQFIYRLEDTDYDGRADSISHVVETLPSSWNGGLNISPADRLVISTGADCPACGPDDLPQGALLSIALDGSDIQVIAEGLHATFDVAWHPLTGEPFAADDQPPRYAPFEEINRIITGADYGWPDCYETDRGSMPVPNASASACEQVIRPFYRLPAYTAPAGIVFYTGAAFPEFAGDLLIALQGERHGPTAHGYALARLCLDAAGQPEPCLDAYGRPVLDQSGATVEFEILVPADIHYGYPLEVVNLQQQGFFPEHPLDIAISPEGHIAVSLREGRVIRITPVASHITEN